MPPCEQQMVYSWLPFDIHEAKARGSRKHPAGCCSSGLLSKPSRDCFLHSEVGEGGSGKVAPSSSMITPINLFCHIIFPFMEDEHRGTLHFQKNLKIEPWDGVNFLCLSLALSLGFFSFFNCFLSLKCWFYLRSQTSTEMRPHNTTSVHTAKVTAECGRPSNTLQLVHNKHPTPVFPGFHSGEYASS